MATALGIVVLVGVSVWLDAWWTLVGTVIALAIVHTGATIYIGTTVVDQTARSVPAKALQPSVDALAQRAGIAPPQVEVEAGRTGFACSIHARFRVMFAPPEAVDAMVLGDADEREETLASIAHEIGHARRPLPDLVTLSGRAIPIFVACGALLTFSLRSWALLTATSYLFVCLPARWTLRWAERDADETARELGYGAALASDIEASRSPRRWWAPGLAIHPPNQERIRRLRS
jgi:Zn-dependent protease with chaperone function